MSTTPPSPERRSTVCGVPALAWLRRVCCVNSVTDEEETVTILVWVRSGALPDARSGKTILR